MNITAPPRRIPVRQAAAIWTVVFLIGLTAGELLRQQTLDDPILAATRGVTEPTTTTPRASTAVAPTTTSTITSPAQTTTKIDDKEQSRGEDGKSESGHGKPARPRDHRKADKSKAG
jgi:hypothetical protein